MSEIITIYGAGLSGLLAGHILSSKGFNVQIKDIREKEQLKSNHHAVLRFKNDIIGQCCGIKMDQIAIQKSIYYKGNYFNSTNPFFNNLYSYKISRKYDMRKISCENYNNLDNIRYIPPVDFYEQLLKLNHDKIISNCKFDKFEPKSILTIPLPVTLDILQKQHNLKFIKNAIWVINGQLECDMNLNQTLYYPDYRNPDYPFYRCTITGNNFICEISEASWSIKNIDVHEIVKNVLHTFGIFDYSLKNSSLNRQEIGKLISLQEKDRHKILYNLTKEYQLYSLGRFACWRNIMLPDVVNDIDKIANWLDKKKKLTDYEIQQKSFNFL